MKSNELSVRHFSYKPLVLLVLLFLTALLLASCKTVAPSDLVYGEITTGSVAESTASTPSNTESKPLDTGLPESTAAVTTAPPISNAVSETNAPAPDTLPESCETFSYEYPAFFSELVDRMIMRDKTFAAAVSKYEGFDALVPKVLYVMPIELVELPDINVDPSKNPELKKYYPIDVYVSYAPGDDELIARCRFSVSFTDYLEVAKPNSHENYDAYVESMKEALTHRQILISAVLSSGVPQIEQKAYAALIGDNFLKIDPYHIEITEAEDGTKQYVIFTMSYDTNGEAYSSIISFSSPDGYDSWDKIQTALANKTLSTAEMLDLVVKTLRVNAAYRSSDNS